MERISRREIVGYLVALLFDILEYLILFYNSIHVEYPILSLRIQREITFNILNGAAWVGIFGTLISFPLTFLQLFFPVTYGIISILKPFIVFSVIFLGTFFSVRYFLKKYFDAKGFLSFAVPIAVSIPVPFTWYTIDGVIYFFPGVFALILALLDYSLDAKNKIKIKEGIRRGAIAALAVTLGFTDPRGIMFALLTFFVFSLYFLVLYRSRTYIINWFKIFIPNIFFFLLLNINTIIYTEIVKPFIPLVGVSTVYNQLGIALQSVEPFYTITGIMYWLNPSYYLNLYHANIVFGALGTAVSLSALLIRRRPIIILLSVFILSVTTYNYLGSQTLGYYLAQTPYFGYIVYLYPTYLPSYLFVAPFYILVGFVVFYLARAVNKGFLKYVKSLLVIVLLISPLIAFYSPIALAFQHRSASPIPLYLRDAVNTIASNDSGVVLGFGSSNILSNFFLPSFTSPNFYGYMNFIWASLSISKNWAKTLAYLGIQYLVYANTSVPAQVLNNSDFKLIYNSSNVIVFENSLYKPYIVSKGIYVAYNFPCVLSDLSGLNQTYSVVPFYYVNNLSEILPYVKGFIGYNVDVQDIIPMIANNNSIIISADKIYLNQFYSRGWLHQSPFWTPDVLDAIFNGGNGEPLNVTVPNGVYYVYILPIFTTLSQNPFINHGEVTLVSENETKVSISGSAYNVSWTYGGIIKIWNETLKIYANRVNIVKIVLIPASQYKSTYQEALSLLKSRDMISFENNTVYIHQSNFSPKGYGIVLFSSPWLIQFVFTHYAKIHGNVIFSTAYYFGVANVYITTNQPKIVYTYMSDLPFISINFAIDVIIILFATNSVPLNKILSLLKNSSRGSKL